MLSIGGQTPHINNKYSHARNPSTTVRRTFLLVFLALVASAADAQRSIPLTLECRGSLKQLFAFFQAMEDMDRLVRFEEVKFENDSDFNAVVKLNVKANVYYQSDDKGNS